MALVKMHHSYAALSKQRDDLQGLMPSSAVVHYVLVADLKSRSMSWAAGVGKQPQVTHVDIPPSMLQPVRIPEDDGEVVPIVRMVPVDESEDVW